MECHVECQRNDERLQWKRKVKGGKVLASLALVPDSLHQSSEGSKALSHSHRGAKHQAGQAQPSGGPFDNMVTRSGSLTPPQVS